MIKAYVFITMIPVASSNVRSIGFVPTDSDESDFGRGDIIVRFINSNRGQMEKVYGYRNATRVEYNNLRDAPSVGTFLNKYIKPNHTFYIFYIDPLTRDGVDKVKVPIM